MPIELLQSGYIRIITYKQRSVNLYGEKFSDVFRLNSAENKYSREMQTMEKLPKADNQWISYKNPSASNKSRRIVFGRSGGIRTRGLMDPNHARYQTSPHPDSLNIIMKKMSIVKCFRIF